MIFSNKFQLHLKMLHWRVAFKGQLLLWVEPSSCLLPPGRHKFYQKRFHRDYFIVMMPSDLNICLICCAVFFLFVVWCLSAWSSPSDSCHWRETTTYFHVLKAPALPTKLAIIYQEQNGAHGRETVDNVAK